MLGHNESYSKMVRYRYEASDKSQAAEGEKDEVEAILNLASRIRMGVQFIEYHMTTESG